MGKEFGKWLMDIAKYITTAVIISAVFGETEGWTLYCGASIAVVVSLLCGLALVSNTSLLERYNRIKNIFTHKKATNQ